MSTSYTSALAVQNYLQTTLKASFTTQLNAYIEAMSEYCDTLAGYPIYTDAVTTRTYDGSGLRLQAIDHVHTITAVTVDEVTVTPLQVPYNSDTKTELKLTNNYFTASDANVSVTGKHSLKKTLPAQVAHACTVFVAVILTQVKDQRDGVKSEKIGEYSVSFASEEQRSDYMQAKAIIESYRPISF